jgi:DNA invertase Pin-like site-specific DNA recombinase
MQTRELREYCERRRWQVAGEYVDLGISGAKEKRPELDRLRQTLTADDSMRLWCGSSTDSLGRCHIC